MANYLNSAGCLSTNDKKLELFDESGIFNIGKVTLENIG